MTKYYAMTDAGGFVVYCTSAPDDAEITPMHGTTAVELEGPLSETPQAGLKFHLASRSWVDARDIAAIKASNWDRIKKIRAAMDGSGFVWDGSKFDSDGKSQEKIISTAAIAAASPGLSVLWTLADNTSRELSSSDLVAVGAALVSHLDANHRHSQELRAKIDAAATEKDLDAISW